MTHRNDDHTDTRSAVFVPVGVMFACAAAPLLVLSALFGPVWMSFGLLFFYTAGCVAWLIGLSPYYAVPDWASRGQAVLHGACMGLSAMGMTMLGSIAVNMFLPGHEYPPLRYFTIIVVVTMTLVLTAWTRLSRRWR